MAIGSKGKILHVAREQFYRSGFLATSVDDIIAHAKVSKSNFYYHFKSKEELGLAVLDTRCEEFDSAIAATLCNDGFRPFARIEAFLELIAEVEAQHATGGCPFGNLVAEMSEHSERFRTALSSMFCRLVTILSQVIAEGQEIGEVREDIDAEAAGALIVQAIQGANLLQKCHRNRSTNRDTYSLSLKLLKPAPLL